MKGLNPSPATTPSRGDRHPLQGHPNASFPPVQGLFLLGKSFLGSGVEGSLSLQPGSRAAPCSRGRRQGVLMQARETRSPWPSGLQLQARGRGATPALALAGPEPDPLPAGVIAQLRVPAGRRRTPRSERTAGPGDRGAGDGSRCSRAAPRRPAGARGPRWELRFISFSLLLLLGSSPLGRSDAGAPREPHTPHTTRGGGVGAEDSEVHPRLPGLGLRVSPHSAAAHTPLLGWPSPLPSASPARPRCPSVASTALTLCSCRNRCTKGRGAGVGGRVRGAGRELAASAGPRPIRSAPSPCPAGGPWAAAAAGRSREQSGEQAEGRPRRGLSSLALPPWGAALALLLAALALLALRLRRPSRRAVGARTLPGARSEDHGEVDGGGPAGQLSDGREPLPGGCRLICKPSALAQCLLRALRRSAALEPGPLPWLFGPHLQTLCHFVLPVGPGSELAREYLQLADDGLVALDWVVGPGARGRRATNAGGLPAVLLVIPNAWGRLTRNVLGLCLLALERGYYPVIFHRRGHHGCPLVSPRLQPFGDPSDLKEAITYIRFRHPATPLFAVSEGSGSALLLSYLGECGSSSYVTGAACISPVLRCREWFEAGLPWPYERGFLLHQKIALSRYATALEDTVDTGKLFRSRSLREFEEALFCHTKSFPISWDTYWDHNDPLRDVDEAAVPVLCICSADDPVCGPPSHFLPTELFHSNPYFFLLLSRHGGHCGFLRQEPLPAWSHDVTLEYFRALTDFFRTEERMKGLSKHRASFLAGRRRWGTLPKREVSPSSSLEEIFSWKRSYTR